jgi:hypothetical protein
MTPFTYRLLLFFFFTGILACDTPVTGVDKNMNTVMMTTYSGLKPTRSFLVMNDEELNHTDIPIGEQFMVVNEGITGLTVKEGKVSVGCALTITDSKGKLLMNEPDLFKGNNEYPADSLRMLRCMVTTGEPMKWEEKYDVKVVFTDRFGKGRLENKVTIRAIDIP